MYLRTSIEFTTEDQIILRGWLYTPNNITTAPGIIMTHGFSGLKEHYLSKFAEVFAEAGLNVLVYDNRNFGESDGSLRFEVDPEAQVRDMQEAITFMQSLPKVEPKKMGLWGTSFSAGNVITLSAQDKRIGCVVIQVPFVSGHHPYLKEKKLELWNIIQKKYAADHKARAEKKAPSMTPVVTIDPEKSVVMKQPEAYQFFTSVPEWQNQVTLKSVENAGDYHPIELVDQISPIPILFIVAAEDTVCPTHLALAAYEKAGQPKECVIIPGEHFSPYHEQFTQCSQEACLWFTKYLSK